MIDEEDRLLVIIMGETRG